MGAIAELYATINADASPFQKQLTGVKSALGDLGGIIQGISFLGIFGAAIKSASESELAFAQLNAVLRSTDGAAGVTRDMALGLASGLQKVTRFSDETILSAENMLLTFTRISKDAFPAATEATLDLATAMGGDVKGAAIQLGKALNAPIYGITALTRVGVTFTEKQKQMIRAFEATNQHGKAMKIILDEIGREFGGSARAAGETFAGTLDRLKNAFDDVLENVGNALIPTLKVFANILLSVAGVIQQVDPGFVQLAAAIGLVVVAAGPLGAILGAILSPLGAIALAVGVLYAAWTNNFGGLRTSVENAWKEVQGPLAAIKDAISGFFDTLFNGPQIKEASQHGIQEGMGQANLDRAVLPFGERLKEALTKLGGEIQIAIGKLTSVLGPAFDIAAQIFDKARIAATQLAAILGFGLGLALSVVANLLNQAAITAGQLGLILRTGIADALSKIDATSLGYVVVGLGAISALVIGNKIALGISAIVTAIQAMAAGATLTLPALGPLGAAIAVIGVITFLAANNVLGLGDRIKELGETLKTGSPGFQQFVNDALVGLAGKLAETAKVAGDALKAIQALVNYILGHPTLTMTVQINQTPGGLGMPGVGGDRPAWIDPQGNPHYPPPGRAAGGLIRAGMFSSVRDNEFFRPAASGQIIPLSAMSGSGTGGTTINVNGPITVIANNPQQMWDALKREGLRRNKAVAESM